MPPRKSLLGARVLANPRCFVVQPGLARDEREYQLMLPALPKWMMIDDK